MRARVEIHLKKGVADPEGENVLKALKLLGFTSVTGVRSIKVFEIDVAGTSASKARAAVEEMCRKQREKRRIAMEPRDPPSSQFGEIRREIFAAHVVAAE